MPIDNLTLSLFLATVIVFILTPGPNMIFCVSRAIVSGSAAGIYSALGVCMGLTIHATAAGLGLSSLFAHFPLIYDALRIGGAGYLLWLAWQTWRGDMSPLVSSLNPGHISHPSNLIAPRFFIQGALNALLSPKAVFFYLVLFPQFLKPAQGSVLVQSLFLIAIINVINFAVIASLCLCAGSAAGWLKQHPRVIIWQQRSVAGIFAALAIRVFFSRPSSAAA